MSDTFTTDAPSVDTAPISTDTGIPSGPVDAPIDAPVASTEPSAVPSGDVYDVTVNGETQQVTLDELRNGYSRQADYTRKTQELATERARLQQAEALATAFERDPHATLSALSDAYGWTPAQTAQAAQQLQTQAPFQEQAPAGQPDPIDERFSRVEQFIARQERQAAQQRIEQEFSTLETQYGEIDRDAVVTHAVKKGVDLVTAYRDMQFDVQRQNAAALEAKRAAQVVEGGAATQPRAVTKAPVENLPLRDIIERAVRGR